MAQFESHLESILASVTNPDVTVECDGSCPTGAGTALTCRYDHPDWPEGSPAWTPLLVAVLDDSGRYTFNVLDLAGGYATPEEYPRDSTSCVALANPPTDRNSHAGTAEGSTDAAAASSVATGAQTAGGSPTQGLTYPSLLYHWFTLGRPTGMDADGDGRPCEGQYPARVIDRVMGSPLSPGADRPEPGSVTLQDVRIHAEAIRNGTVYPETLNTCGSSAPALTGSTLVCRDQPDEPNQTFGVYFSVLDDTGRYALAIDDGIYESTVTELGPTAGCVELSQPPGRFMAGEYGPLSYGLLLYHWNTLGRPADWDQDRDGAPCEDHYPADAIAAVMESPLQP